MRRWRSLLPIVMLTALTTPLIEGSARAITRCEALDRAQQWVDLGLLYSQSPNWNGYRTDCSGLVSWAWGLPPPGHTTSSFAGGSYDDGVSYVIDPSELQPGDAVNDPGHHVMLYVSGDFYSGRIEVYEEYNWGEPAVRRWRNFDPSSYLAIRYVDIQPCCTPSAESCNGVDDDCDGAVDEGVTRSCVAGVGDCRDGAETCSGGAWGACVGAHGPSAEGCDGRDNDCDGTVDEDIGPRTCGTDEGECQSGIQTCSGGGWGACAGSIAPAAEECDGKDNDCDGGSDEDLSRVCGSDVGDCQSGIETCSAGVWSECVGAIGGTPERCDGLDNDCDVAIDDDDACEIEEVAIQAGMADVVTDVDGDGRADLCGLADAGFGCYRGTGHGFDVALAWLALPDADDEDELAVAAGIHMGDLDGDGLADACVAAAGVIDCWRSLGWGFEAEPTTVTWGDAESWGGAEHTTTLRLVDMDGDGRDDLCARGPDGLRCAISTGAGFGRELQLVELSDAAGYDRVEHFGTIRFGDLDGDGRADVCARGDDGMSCWLGTGESFLRRVPGPRWSDAAGWTTYDRWSTIRLADVNGDGRDDLCGRAAGGMECHLFTGAGFGVAVQGPPLADDAGWRERSYFATIRMADVNGDGAVDLCARSGAGMTCWLWSGMGFARFIEGPALDDGDGWLAAPRYQSIRLADLDADGRADVLARDESGLGLWHGTGTGFPTLIFGPDFSDAHGWGSLARVASLRIGSSTTTSLEAGSELVTGSELMTGGCRITAGGRGGAARDAGGDHGVGRGGAMGLVLAAAAWWWRRRRANR